MRAGDDDEGDFYFNADEVQTNLSSLTVKEQAQQNVLLQQFNAVGSGASGAAAASGSAAAAAPSSAAAAASTDATKKQAQTLQKINALFDSLPEPNPQLAAALAAAPKPQNPHPSPLPAKPVQAPNAVRPLPSPFLLSSFLFAVLSLNCVGCLCCEQMNFQDAEDDDEDEDQAMK